VHYPGWAGVEDIEKTKQSKIKYDEAQLSGYNFSDSAN
jgi:hypothetical protein